MSIRLTLQPPVSTELISRIRIYRSLFLDASYSLIADLNATDGNGNFITTYEDPCGSKNFWYKVGYLSNDSTVVSGLKVYKNFNNKTSLFIFPSSTVINNGQTVYLGSEATRDEFEAKYTPLPLTALYFSAPTFFSAPNEGAEFTIKTDSGLTVSGIKIDISGQSYISLNWMPCEILSDPVRSCAVTPIKIEYSLPDIPKDWQVTAIYIKRSDAIDGTYDVIAKLNDKISYESWQTSFVDLGGSDQFFYKIAFETSRWDKNTCQTVSVISPDSDPMTPVFIDGERIVKIVYASPVINDQKTSESITFNTYPYCGYHRFSPHDVFMGKSASPYSRPLNLALGKDCGNTNLFGGPLSIYDQNIQRQIMLLQVTGESVILLRRKWSGEVCKCMGKTEEHPIKQCPSCMGTGFVGGFDRVYFNVDDSNPEGRIMVRFSPAVDDLNIGKFTGLDVINQPSAWTIAQPIIRDRDILVQFDPIDKEREIWRYVVLDVNRNAFMGGVGGAQVLRLQRLNRYNDIAYSIPLSGTMYTEKWDMQANLHNSYGNRTGEKDKAINLDANIPTPRTPADVAALLHGYSLKLWALLRAGIIPSPAMISQFVKDNHTLIYVSLGDKATLVPITAATINNYSLLRYASVEIETVLNKDFIVKAQYVSTPMPSNSTMYFNLAAGSTSTITTVDRILAYGGELSLSQSSLVKSLIMLYVDEPGEK